MAETQHLTGHKTTYYKTMKCDIEQTAGGRFSPADAGITLALHFAVFDFSERHIAELMQFVRDELTELKK